MNGMEIEFDIGTDLNKYKYIKLINTETLANYTPVYASLNIKMEDNTTQLIGYNPDPHPTHSHTS